MAIFVGTGVGAGLILDGRIYHGKGHTAGEIGHTVIAGRGALGHRPVEDMASRSTTAGHGARCERAEGQCRAHRRGPSCIGASSVTTAWRAIRAVELSPLRVIASTQIGWISKCEKWPQIGSNDYKPRVETG